jgi:glutamate-1-semialdehyde 2,1-aminomutase
MQEDGWWWAGPKLTNKSIRRGLLKEMLQARWLSPIGSMSSPRIK